MTVLDGMRNADFLAMSFACCGVKLYVLIHDDSKNWIFLRQIIFEFVLRSIVYLFLKYAVNMNNLWQKGSKKQAPMWNWQKKNHLAHIIIIIIIIVIIKYYFTLLSS